MEKKFDYNDWIHFVLGMMCGLLIFMMLLWLMPSIYAEDNITNGTIIINNTYIFNQSFFYNTTINQTFNYTINQTVIFNITNVTCINCSYYYNVTNFTYFNMTNITYNGSNFNPSDYYNKGEIDSKYNVLNQKFDNYLLKNDYNGTNVTALSWRGGTDTFLSIGIVLAILIGIIAIVVAIRGGVG